MSAPSPAIATAQSRAIGLIATGSLIALLYFARDVLIPITLAVLLSLLLWPLVRALRRVGFGPTGSVLATVLGLMLCVGALATVIGVNLARMAASLPQYEDTIRDKLAALDELTVTRFKSIEGQMGHLLGEREEARPAVSARALRRLSAMTTGAAAAPIPVELHPPPPNAMQLFQRVLGTVWTPLETALIVLVVLFFVLLEHETVRDRFIRILGSTDLRTTTLALDDAGERLSRFFVSQFSVNLGMGVAIWLGLLAIGLPHAFLWGALAATLRFVPYVGLWIAALFSTVLAAAVEPGWTLALETLGLFVLVELIASQLVEPFLYGHTTGLSPLSVVIAAIFWSWVWGPMGLVLSTPLTLCLVVAGRHLKGFSMLELLLGNSPALSMPQRFYQRALAGDSQEIITAARLYLKQKSVAAYCDAVILPALHLASLDFSTGRISQEQQVKVRESVVTVIESIAGERVPSRRRGQSVSVLDEASPGRILREHREALTGRWQGPLDVAPASIILCVSLGSPADDLTAELLVRIVRAQGLDARHVSLEDLAQPPPDASPAAVAVVFLVSAFPSGQRRLVGPTARGLRPRIPRARLVTLFLRGLPLQGAAALTDSIADNDDSADLDAAATSIQEALRICLEWKEQRVKRDR